MKLELTANLTLKASEGGKPRRFSILAYSGGPLNVDGFDTPVIVDLDGLEIPGAIPILIDHTKSVEATLGVTDAITNDGQTLSLAGVVTGVSAMAQQVLAQSAAGHQWQASIGAAVNEQEEIRAGQTVSVNGREFSGPVIVARRSVLRETSVLPMGADHTTTVNLAASAANIKGAASMPTFEEWIMSLGLDASTLTPENTAALQLAYETVTSEPAMPTANAMATEMPEEEELPTANAKGAKLDIQASMKELRAKTAAHFAKVGQIEVIAAGHSKIAATAIANDWSLEKVELEVIKANAAKTRPTSFNSAQNNPQNLPQVLEAALCVSRKHKDVEKQFDDQTLQAAHSQFRRGVGLQQMMLMAASANGMQLSAGMRIGAGNLREVMQYAFSNQIQAGFSTLSLPGLLSNVANKELLEGYMEEEQTWREVSRTASVSDFKTATSYRLLDDMEYEELGAGGKIKHGTIGEESYTRQARTYAKMFALTRTDMINDDLSALDDLRNRVGRGAAKKLNRVFWAKWLDNAAFFTAARGNYITGSTTTLLTDYVGLGLALDAFDDLRTPSADGSKVPGGKFGGTPSILLTPGGGISRVAEAIYVNQNIGGGTQTSEANIHYGKYKPVKSVFLNDSSISGGSATAWYLLRNPSEAAGVVVSFLDGVETPTVENADADFDTLGIQFRGYHDFGVDFAEYLCGVKSKGAA
jgi:hypothetical protein